MIPPSRNVGSSLRYLAMVSGTHQGYCSGNGSLGGCSKAENPNLEPQHDLFQRDTRDGEAGDEDEGLRLERRPSLNVPHVAGGEESD